MNQLSYALLFDGVYQYFIQNGLALIESDMNNNLELLFYDRQSLLGQR